MALDGFSNVGPSQLIDISSRGFAAQSSLSGDFSGNSNTTHRITTNNYSLQVPSYIPCMRTSIANLDLKLMAKNLCSDI